VIGEADYTGTNTNFQPDPEIFEETGFDLMHCRQDTAKWHSSKKEFIYSIDDRKRGSKRNVHYEGGIVSFVEYLKHGPGSAPLPSKYIEGSKDDHSVK
jgi:DNA gyrase subunit B